MKMNRQKRNRSTGGFLHDNNKSLSLSSGVTAHRQGGHERRDRGDRRGKGDTFQIIQWLNSTKLFFSYRNLQNGKNIYTQHQKKKLKQLFLPLLYILWGLCDPPLFHGSMVIKSVWVQKKKEKTVLKLTSWSSWERVQTGTKTHRKPRNSWRRHRAMARGYKVIKNSHVNNIIITRVTVICLKRYRRKW